VEKGRGSVIIEGDESFGKLISHTEASLKQTDTMAPCREVERVEKPFSRAGF
jgi:hypothetical protein